MISGEAIRYRTAAPTIGGESRSGGSMRVERHAMTPLMRRASNVAAVLVLSLAATLFVLRPLSFDLPGTGLDASWVAVLGEAATRPARWGVDLVFTYGPASALVTRYYTDDYLTRALPILLAVAVVYGVCVVRLTGLSVAGRRGAIVLAIAVAAAQVAGLAADLALDQDGFVFAFGLVVLLLDLTRHPGDRTSLATLVAAAAILGVLSVSKTSYGVAALVFCLLADARALLVGRRLPLLVPILVAAFLAAYLAYGQRLGDLPNYLRLQGDEAAGYGEAMYLIGGRRELAAYLIGAAALVAIAAWAGPSDWIRRTLATLGTAFGVAIAFKAGFIRADIHTQIAWSLLGLAGLAVAVALVLPRSVAAAAALGAASLAILWIVAPLFLLVDSGDRAVPSALGPVYRDMADSVGVETGAWAGLLRDPLRFAAEARAAKAQAWETVRSGQPLPRLEGGVDILPSDQSAVLANGLDYHPRPSFQEYSTYTAGLIAANAAFYRGPDAPAWVLYGGGGLDERYPTSVEGALWPDLLRLYEPTRLAGPWLALHRRAVPLPDVLGAPQTLAATLGGTLALPPSSRPVFARIIVRKTLLGRLAALAFRPPALSLRIRTADGHEASYRFIPALGAAGFLLSPLVAGTGTFAELGFGDTDDLGGQVVTEVTVAGGRLAGLFYERPVSIVLQPVSVAPVPPTPDAKGLFDDLARERPWRLSAIAAGRAHDLKGDRLAADAPSSVRLPVDADEHHLRIGFGIADGAWTAGTTRGVCFSIASVSDAAAPLWRRCLDPMRVTADRGRQTAEIDLPPGTAAIAADTTCRQTCDWGWSYWDDIRAEP